MSDPTSERKIQHIRIIERDADADRRKYYFDDIQLTHRALPEIALDDVDPSVTFMGKRLRFPLLISSMTGGEHDLIRAVNENLARAAEATGVAMGVGSQRVMFTHPPARASFALREWAPTTLLLSNLGAVQLNYGFTPEMCREAVDVVGADALYLHLNPLQEAVQPEGNTNFVGLAQRIGEAVTTLDHPVVIKEVGAGISPEDARLLVDAGVRYIDVAGTGGLSWSRIEDHRQAEQNGTVGLGIRFQDWGIPTPLALQLLAPFRDRVTLIASGGIRSGIDMVKATILGASLCGLASPFLKPAMESADRVIEEIERLNREFRTAMFLLGARTVDDLFDHGELIVNR
jgi:isopentenyl-diphosphate Delta-isomerase